MALIFDHPNVRSNMTPYYIHRFILSALQILFVVFVRFHFHLFHLYSLTYLFRRTVLLLQRSKQRCHTRLPSACAYSRTRSCSFQSPLHCVGCRVMSCYFSCSLFPASCTTMDFCLYSAPLLSYVTLIPPLQPSPMLSQVCSSLK